MTEKQIIRAEIRAKKKAEKEAQKLLKKNKPKPTETELVHRYVNRVIKNSMYHGRVDTEKFKGLEHTHSVSKNLWMDTDFFFSVVFQSSTQKRKFLEQLLSKFEGLKEPDEEYNIQIINGLELAKLMGIKLDPETTKEYPTGNIELMPMVLDGEEI